MRFNWKVNLINNAFIFQGLKISAQLFAMGFISRLLNLPPAGHKLTGFDPITRIYSVRKYSRKQALLLGRSFQGV